MAKSYQLSRIGRSLLLRTAIKGNNGKVIVARLIVDTGASYTMLPVEVVEALGYDTHHPLRTIRIVAANGIVVAPLIKVSWMHCLGQQIVDFPVIAHTLPSGTYVDGLLGMDFLENCQAVIDVGEATVRCNLAVHMA